MCELIIVIIPILVSPAGSTYDGFWREGNKHGVGLFRPPPPADPKQAVGDLISASRVTYRRSAPATTAPAMAASSELTAQGADVVGTQPRDTRRSKFIQSMPPRTVQKASVGADAGAVGGSGGGGGGAPEEAAAAAAEDFSLFSVESHGGALGAVADSTVGGPTLASNKKEVFIRKFDGGRLEREDKLTKEDIKVRWGGCSTAGGDDGGGVASHCMSNLNLSFCVPDHLWGFAQTQAQQDSKEEALGQEGSRHGEKTATEAGPALIQGHAWVRWIQIFQ